METFITVLCCFLMFFAVCLVVLILLQSDKSAGMSGAISGNAETFYGKSKGRAKDALLSKLTTIFSIVFVLIIIAIYILQ